MRKILLATVALGALGATQALAADMVRPAPRVVAAPAPAAFNWTGAYFGVQAGYGWGSSTVDFGSGPVDTDPNGAFLGGELAYLWQVSNFAFGLYGEANYSWAHDTNTTTFAPATYSTDINWFGSAGAKLGFALDRVLLYATGGVAFGGIETGQNGPVVFTPGSTTDTFVGWSAGAGVDFALTNSVILGLQYRYYDFGSKTVGPFGAGYVARSQDVNLHTVVARASLKF